MQFIENECMVAIIIILLLFLSDTKERKDDNGKLKTEKTMSFGNPMDRLKK